MFGALIILAKYAKDFDAWVFRKPVPEIVYGDGTSSLVFIESGGSIKPVFKDGGLTTEVFCPLSLIVH